MHPQEFERKLAAILSANAIGYSRLTGEDNDATVRNPTGHSEMRASFIPQGRARVIFSTGDNLLTEFKSVLQAVSSDGEIQRDIAERADYQKRKGTRSGLPGPLHGTAAHRLINADGTTIPKCGTAQSMRR